MARLRDKYQQEVLPKLMEQAGTKNPMAVPRLEKIVVSMGVGRAVQDKKVIDVASKDLATITGQRPAICNARKSVSNFKVRAGMPTGLKVTLRGARMYEFLDRLISIVIPRIRDFRGLNLKSFDGRGNYSMGLAEQTVFPEIDAGSVEMPQGMNITMVTSAKSDRDCRSLLQMMGLPLRKEAAAEGAGKN